MSITNRFSKFTRNILIGSRKGKARKSTRRTATSAEVLEDRVLLAAVYGDFNNDGVLDRATSDQYADVPFQDRAGSVEIRYGGVDSGVRTLNENQFGVEGAAATGERFGATLAVGDFNGDGYDDLVVGVPGQTVDGEIGAGSAHLFFGSSQGLTTRNNRVLQQNADVPGSRSESGDGFGSVLTVGNFNGDAFDDLAVGIPGENNSAGEVNLFHGSSSGLQQGDSFSQDSPSIEGTSERADSFGAALVSDDFNGDGYDDLAIGVPNETIERNIFLSDYDNAGAVNIIYGSSTGLTSVGNQLFRQGANGVGDAPEDNDGFGRSLTSGDFDGDGVADLVIGVSGEDPFVLFGEVSDAGQVHVLYGSRNSGLSGSSDQILNHNSAGVAGLSIKDDGFGEVLRVGDFNGDLYDDLVIKVQFRQQSDLRAYGEVIVIYGSAAGLRASTNDGAVLPAEQYLPPNLEILFYGQDILVGDVNDDGFVDLRVSITGLIADQSIDDSDLFYGTSNGLTRNKPVPTSQPLPPIGPLAPVPNEPTTNDPTVTIVQQPYFVNPGPSLNGSPTFLADDTPTLKWTKIVGASGGYNLLVYDKAAGVEVVNEDSLSTYSFTTTQLTPGRVYQAFVQGEIYDGTTGPYSAPREFIITASKVAEPTGDYVAKWATQIGAASYDLLAYDTTLGKEIANVKGITATAYDLATSLTGVAKFTVYTRPNFAVGATGAWAPVESVGKTGGGPVIIAKPGVSIPTTPTLLGPAGGNIGTKPSITWTSSTNATSYELLIYNKDNGQQVLSQAGIASTSFQIATRMAADTNYQVFVRSATSAGQSAWSSPLEFKTAGTSSAPATPVFLLSSGAQLSSQPTIAWNPAANAATYDVLLYNKTTGQLVAQATALTGTTFTPAVKLTADNEYQMFVKAVNTTGDTSPWSTPLEFGIVTRSLSLIPDAVFADAVVFDQIGGIAG